METRSLQFLLRAKAVAIRARATFADRRPNFKALVRERFKLRLTLSVMVQIIKAVLLFSGSLLMVTLICARFGFDLEKLFQTAVALHPQHSAILAPGGFSGPVCSRRAGSANKRGGNRSLTNRKG